jgi:acyl dehydratase
VPSAAWPGVRIGDMRFADIPVGLIDGGRRVVTEDEIVEFASKYDPQPFHVDRAAAARTRWGGVIASGWHTCSIAMSLAVAAVLRDSESVGSPGVEDIRWEAPVRAGDELALTIRVLSKRISSSGEYGILRWTWEVHNQTAVRVLSVTATSLFAVGGAREPAGTL